MAGSRGSSSRARLGADVWIDAGLRAIGRGGVAAVAVEPLAAELGVTKGSFYWHFENRGALLEAVMQRWEELATRDVIAAADRAGTPVERLALLLEIVVMPSPEDAVETALASAGADPIVSPAVERVTKRRLDYLASIFREVGFSRPVAARRAYTAYAAYLGMMQLDARSSSPRTTRSSRTFVKELVEMYTSGAPSR